MSIDVSNQGKFVFYVNFREVGDGLNFAEAEQIFKFSELIDDASKYIISIERFKIPVQSLPMLPNIQNAIQLIPKTAVPPANFNLNQTFSVYDFLNDVNAFFPGFIVSFSPDGRWVIDFNDFSNYSIQLDPVIANVFDMDQNLGGLLIGANTIIGATPGFDRFDQLYKIQLEGLTGLSAVQQEIINTNVFRNLLTDFIIPSNWSMSFSGTQGTAPNGTYNIVYPVREDLEFNASSNRRFIFLRGNSPIQNMRIQAVAIFRDNTRHRIVLPPRTIFEVKLAFWKK